MGDYDDIIRLTDELLWDNHEAEQKAYINQLGLIYRNLPSTHKYKWDLLKYINFFKNDEESWISANQFIELWKKLRHILPDDIWQKIRKLMDERAWKASEIIDINR